MATVKAKTPDIQGRISQLRKDAFSLVPSSLDVERQRELIADIEAALKQEKAALAAHYRQNASINRILANAFNALADVHGIDRDTRIPR